MATTKEYESKAKMNDSDLQKGTQQASKISLIIHQTKARDLQAKICSIMKNIKTAFVLLAIVAFTGCIGDHGVGSGQDTAQNTYQVTTDKPKSDTTNIIRYTGDSQSMDYSANGGSGLIKPDTNIKR